MHHDIRGAGERAPVGGVMQVEHDAAPPHTNLLIHLVDKKVIRDEMVTP
jgi:hypothetical protein